MGRRDQRPDPARYRLRYGAGDRGGLPRRRSPSRWTLDGRSRELTRRAGEAVAARRPKNLAATTPKIYFVLTRRAALSADPSDQAHESAEMPIPCGILSCAQGNTRAARGRSRAARGDGDACSIRCGRVTLSKKVALG